MPKTNPKSYRQLNRSSKDTLIYLYVRGYWLTRYFDHVHHDVLRDLLSKRQRSSSIIAILAETVSCPTTEFWQRIDDEVVKYFSLT